MTTSKERENSLWKWLDTARKKCFTAAVAHLHRVENMVETGCPDVEGCIYTKAFWTELKTCPAPGPSGLVDVKLEGEQQYWLFARNRAGGRAWLLIRVGEGADRRHYLLKGGEYLKTVVASSVPEEWLFKKSVMTVKKPTAEALLRRMVK